MKKNISAIIALVACVLVVVCLFQIAGLKQQVRNLQGDMSSQISIVSNNVSNLYSNISSKLEEQASLLTADSWEFGDADFDAKTVELLCSVTPKEYTAGTEAAIIIDGSEHAMELTSGDFTAAVDIPLFGEINTAKVIFRDGESIRTEALDWYLSPRYDYLLNVFADFSGSSRGSRDNGVFTQSYNGVVNIQADCKQEYGVASVTLVELLDGQELGRTNIPLDNKDFYANYQSEDGARPEPAAPVESHAPLAGGNPSGPFYYELDKEYEIPFGSTLTLYVEVADENGLLYRCIFDHQEISDSGEPTDSSWQAGSMEASIYDAAGNALYEPDPSLYS